MQTKGTRTLGKGSAARARQATMTTDVLSAVLSAAVSPVALFVVGCFAALSLAGF